MAIESQSIIERFRFSPDILRRLGEELVPDVDQGILELVKNSYDADASSCSIALRQDDKSGSILSISDDGLGMDANSIVNGWLLLGSSAKTSAARTKKGRIPIGNKGLGRLAALRLGSKVTLTTRPAAQPGSEFIVHINWDDFSSVTSVDEVPIEVVSRLSDKGPGTLIEITNLERHLGFREMQRLARGVLLFADPFSHELEFRPTLDSPEFRQLEELVNRAYFDSADFHLWAELDQEGHGTARVLDFNGNELWTTDQADNFSKSEFRAPPCRFQLWNFLLRGSNFANRDANVTEVRNWLRHVGGVHVYRRNIRVTPYGGPDDDWVGMNLARVRSPEERPATNNSIGLVQTDDPSDLLLEKTDRTGFIQNDAYLELRRFCTEALEWMAGRRLKFAERRRQDRRTNVGPNVQRAQKALQEHVRQLPEEVRAPVDKSLEELMSAQVRERRAFDEEVQLYRTIASVGTFTAAFAHETKKPVDQISSMLASFRRRGSTAFGDEFLARMSRPLAVAEAAVDALRNFVGIPLRLLQKERRRVGRVDVSETARELFKAFEWHLERDKVETDLNIQARRAFIMGSHAAIESILSNLITNSINSLNRRNLAGGKRQIRVIVESAPDQIQIRFADSGGGITGISMDEIWLPGRTTTSQGTGIGLTIVRDTVNDLGGSVVASPTSDLGGAEFIVSLPRLDIEQ